MAKERWMDWSCFETRILNFGVLHQILGEHLELNQQEGGEKSSAT